MWRQTSVMMRCDTLRMFLRRDSSVLRTLFVLTGGQPQRLYICRSVRFSTSVITQTSEIQRRRDSTRHSELVLRKFRLATSYIFQPDALRFMEFQTAFSSNRKLKEGFKKRISTNDWPVTHSSASRVLFLKLPQTGKFVR